MLGLFPKDKGEKVQPLNNWRSVIESVAKLLTVLIGLVLLRVAFYTLPMSKDLPPIVPAAVEILIWTAFIAFLIAFGWLVRQQLFTLLPRFPDGGNIVFLVSVLLAAIVGYPAYYSVIVPRLEKFSWAYALFFAVVALGALSGIVALVYRNVDKVIASFSSRHKAEHEIDAAEPSTGQYCPKCAAPYEKGEKFCAECGSPLLTKE